MHDSLPQIDARLKRVLTHRILPASATTVAEVTVSWWQPLGEDGTAGGAEPVALSEALAKKYLPLALPADWGPAWGTTWFRLEVDVPDNDGDLELRVDLGWADHSPGFQCEALAYDSTGRAIKGLHPRNHWLPVPRRAQRYVVYLEAASNPLLLDVVPFVPTEEGDPKTASRTPGFTFRTARLVRVHDEVVRLADELKVLHGLATRLPADSARRWRLSLAMQDALDELDIRRIVETAASARKRLRPVLETPADADAMHVTAVGHAHIDTAWLWPLRETRRKVARTLANVVNLLESGYPVHFALPAAQHVAWLSETHPELFERVRHWVACGSIVPVGGMWVEPDAVLPGGEAMCRQLLHGQLFFEHTFGRRCLGIWLPDSFGYSGALPQIAKLAGAQWFLTQKLSWNRRDTFPHNSFLWEGIDGSRIFTHFPAADTYNSDLSPADLDHAERHFKDKGRANSTLLPFGYGDGGGGPTREMIRSGELMRDLCGAPKVLDTSPDEFFAQAQAELTDPEVWVGELYLELHRGTFTSQCATKRGNRRNEALLRETELWWTMVAVAGLGEYPYDELAALWRSVLTGQFHDILPGTSIAWVHDENAAEHERVSGELVRLSNQARALLSASSAEDSAGTQPAEIWFNGAAVAVCGVPALGAGVPEPSAAVSLSKTRQGWRLASEYLVAHFDSAGQLVSLIDVESGRETIPPGRPAGQLHLVPDFPTAWDAWDVERFQRNKPQIIDQYQVESAGEVLRCVAEFHSSTATLDWALSRDGRALEVTVELDWHEHDLLAKLSLPLDVHATDAAFETQFGHIRRAIHENTSWDVERFEVSVHRWLHIGEPGFSVALANEASYGLDVLRAERSGGGSCVVVRPSLVRGPRFPDPQTDQGRHRFGFALQPGADITAAVALGYRLNHTPVRSAGGALVPLVSAEGAVVEAVKLAEDRSGDIIVRLYEAYGSRRRVLITGPKGFHALRVNLLEEELPGTSLEELAPGRWAANVHPFEIVTIRLEA